MRLLAGRAWPLARIGAIGARRRVAQLHITTSHEALVRAWSLEPRAPRAHSEPLDYDLARCAAHECGHVYWAWRRGLPISKVTVVPGVDYAGVTRPDHEPASMARWLVTTRRGKIDLVGVAVAGPVAESIFDETIAWADASSASDRESAHRNARRLGLNDREAAAYVLFAAERVRRVLEAPAVWAQITALSLELMVKGRMTGLEVANVLREAETVTGAR